MTPIYACSMGSLKTNYVKVRNAGRLPQLHVILLVAAN